MCWSYIMLVVLATEILSGFDDDYHETCVMRNYSAFEKTCTIAVAGTIFMPNFRATGKRRSKIADCSRMIFSGCCYLEREDKAKSDLSN